MKSRTTVLAHLTFPLQLNEIGLLQGRQGCCEKYPMNDRKSLPLIMWHTAAGHGFTCQSVHLCVFVEMRNDHNNLFLVLSAVVVAAEPLVRGLRKLPEDIDWSYSGLCAHLFLFPFVMIIDIRLPCVCRDMSSLLHKCGVTVSLTVGLFVCFL